MKQSRPHTSRASSSGQPANPTSTKATIYQYTVIALVVVYHLLDDHPRHIKYRETHGKSSTSSPRSKNDKNRHTRASRTPSSSECGNTTRDCKNVEQQPHRSATQPRPRQPDLHRGIAFRQKVFYPDSVIGEDTTPSITQRSQAWSRLRSAIPIKRVRWGSIKVHEYEPEYDTNNNSHDQRGTAKKREIWGATTDNDIWDSIDSQDLWGPV